MGVQGLWPILDEFSKQNSLSELNGKIIAVDLGGWIVEALSCDGLKKCKNPHLRNTFFRTSYLLKNKVIPVFVIEGKAPSIKELSLNQRKRGHDSQGSDSSTSRKKFCLMLEQCQEMLLSLGVPCFKSSGEAEAFCALLNLKGLVDGVITEDSDVFLYGANTVYRDFNLDKKDHLIKVYKIDSETNQSWNRRKLVAFALLVGCDYTKGVPKIGKETALKLFDDLNDIDILNRFSQWSELNENELFPKCDFTMFERKVSHCTNCAHAGTKTLHMKRGCQICKNDVLLGMTCSASKDEATCSCEWCLNKENCLKRRTEFKVYKAIECLKDFPDMRVIDEYLNFDDEIPKLEVLRWNRPNLEEFSSVMLEYLGWTLDHSLKEFFPLITLWQLCELKKSSTEGDVPFLYQPISISKKRRIGGLDHFEVHWEYKNCDGNVSNEDKYQSTVEVELFSQAYPKITEEFLKKSEVKKAKLKPVSRRKQNSRMRPLKKKDLNLKITDCFKKVSDLDIAVSSEVKVDSLN